MNKIINELKGCLNIFGLILGLKKENEFLELKSIKDVIDKKKTFALLKRMPFEQIRKEWHKSPLSWADHKAKKWFSKRGWTYEEYLDELGKRNEKY